MNTSEVKMAQLEYMLRWLNQIGMMLSAEKDPDRLLDIILDGSMRITACDAGSIFTVEKDAQGVKHLKFTAVRNTSRKFPFKAFLMPYDTKSIAGACAIKQKLYNFSNIGEISSQLGIKHNDSFDQSINYHTINMLVIPLINIENETIGVLELINKKKSFETFLYGDEDFDKNIIPFTAEEEDVVASLASQTAILIERNRLQQEIRQLFDGLVKGLVTTIDQRDPSTFGHSVHVAQLLKHFAFAVNNTQTGLYKNTFFDEKAITALYYAGLLHDIGKIGVREKVLLKKRRLSEAQVESIQYRMVYLREFLKKQPPNLLSSVELDFLANWKDHIQFIQRISEGFFASDDDIMHIFSLAKLVFHDINGRPNQLIKDEEVKHLIVRRGNLTQAERREMELHSDYTYKTLCDIPWSRDFENVPTITSGHHEKLNGSGYPHGLQAEAIPIETRMLTIVDIYEALVAKDRPYKKPMPVEKALGILAEEVEIGKLDRDLFKIFVDQEVYTQA